MSAHSTALRIVGPTPFRNRLNEEGLRFARRPVEVLQVNLGKRCNQACTHCHVEAGPSRSEMMSCRDVDRVITLLEASPATSTIDLTGGAPELHPEFRRIVVEARRLGRRVLDRCNLTILMAPGQEETPAFLAENGVEIIASMPCYTRENVDRQRGKGVFGDSIAALAKLNALGYGVAGSDLVLSLVYNPGAAKLPPAQEKLEGDYRERLSADFGLAFTNLLTITNMPIARFRHQLVREGELDAYMELLVQSFNPAAAERVMCKTLVSIGWDGQLYDCDFNQMLEIPAGGRSRTIWEIDSLAALERDEIALDDHCYGCTAGAGSSCSGATV
jgi:radical SAM/Cys-rich protein